MLGPKRNINPNWFWKSLKTVTPLKGAEYFFSKPGPRPPLQKSKNNDPLKKVNFKRYF